MHRQSVLFVELWTCLVAELHNSIKRSNSCLYGGSSYCSGY
jgi:hypothetical protein